MELHTERLTLRPWRESDAEALYEQAKDPEVGPWCGWEPHAGPEASLWTIQNILNGPECYALCEKGTDTPIGCIELMALESEGPDMAELGFWLGKPYWGRGYMPEAARELLRHGFTDLGLQAVLCAYFEGNDKSRRAQEKLGFTPYRVREGIEVKSLGRVCRSFVSRLTREAWQSQS